MQNVVLKSSRKIALIALLPLNLCLFGQSSQVTSAEYDNAAARLRNFTSNLVDNNIQTKWLDDNKLKYSTSSNGEVKAFILDPKTGKKENTEPENPRDAFEAMGRMRSGAPQNSVTSPDGKYAAFIKDWNLWVRDLSKKEEFPLTTDGVADFGYATDNAGWKQSERPILLWSPDSKKIATFQQDQRKVNDMYLVKTTVGTPELKAWKYPLPGDSVIIMIHRVIIDLTDAPKLVRLDMPADPRRSTLLDDIAMNGSLMDVAWSDDGQNLLFVSTSRDHKEEKVRLADSKTGKVREVFEETVATQFESGHDAVNWRYFSKTNEILWYSERSDWGHLYLYDAQTGKLKNQLTSGNFVVREISYIDEASRTIYFIGGGKEAGNPYYRYLYKVDFSGKNLQLLTPGKGDHRVQFSPDHKYFTDTYSEPDVPPTTEVRDLNGKLISNLGKADVSRLEESGWIAPTPFVSRSSDDSWDLYGLMYTPAKMEEGKKYPVIVNVYPGPQGGSVSNWSFSASRGDCQSLTELGFIVVQLEGSCNPGRSKSFHDACYGNMAENTIPDQIAGLEYLSKKYGFLDLDKVGVWGHSGGGFATASAMFKYPDFFKVGIAESGNHDNRNYEDEWGERYIGLEEETDGVSNYEKQSNAYYAKNLKGKLMLIHGAMDDNVPPYSTYLVADELMKANKDFDMIILPNARHGYGSDSPYIMRRRWDYFVTHLLGKTPPKEYQFPTNRENRP